MFPRLLAIFIIIPVVEMMILIKLGELFGFWATFGLIIFTGILGASLARSQGFSALSRIQEATAAGRMPGNEIIDGLLVLIGGIVLLTPGLLTDLFGFSLMIPQIRQVIKTWVVKLLEAKVLTGRIQ